MESEFKRVWNGNHESTSKLRVGNMPNFSEICDPVQQKGHDVGQVHSEIMNTIVCKI